MCLFSLDGPLPEPKTSKRAYITRAADPSVDESLSSGRLLKAGELGRLPLPEDVSRRWCVLGRRSATAASSSSSLRGWRMMAMVLLVLVLLLVGLPLPGSPVASSSSSSWRWLHESTVRRGTLHQNRCLRVRAGRANHES
jgi:hypothetical protein